MTMSTRSDEHGPYEDPPRFFRPCNAGDVEAIRRLIAAGADYNAEDLYGGSALYWAVESGSVEAVRVLLDAGADPDAKCACLKPFIAAAQKNRIDLMKLLLEYGASPHILDEDGENALIDASFHGNIEMVDLLLGLGVSPHIVARKGWTALRAATERGHTEVVNRLNAAGAREDEEPDGGF